MFVLYDLIFLVIAVIYLPIYLCKRKFHQGFFARLGGSPKNLKLNRPIWIHAVSVGEAWAIKGLLENLRKVYPEKKFVISTVTPTGNKIARAIAKDADYVTYLPLDFSFIVSSVISRINPALFILAETEIWPNLISCLHKKHIPLIIVNTRISDRSLRGYAAIKLLLKPLLNKIDAFCAQTETDAQRLFQLGVNKDKVHVVGNMKFDIATAEGAEKRNTELADKYKTILGLNQEEKLLIAGSTHPGEEKIILRAYKNLLTEFPNLRLLIAPRHPERAGEIGKLAIKSGFCVELISEIKTKDQRPKTNTVFILDTIGELLFFYSVADIVFVGGSLVKKGGQNILEPAILAKPILFGPWMFNFKDIQDMFLQNQAAQLVDGEDGLQKKIKYLLNNPSFACDLGSRAKALIFKNQGATLKTIEQVKNILG